MAPPPSGLATDDTAADWLRTLLTQPPDEFTPDAAGAGPHRWAVLPSAARPRVLVPLDARAAAGGVLDRDTGLGGSRRRLAATLFRTGLVPPGLGGRIRSDPSPFVAWLARVAGQDPADVVAGLTIGPPRPNRKAVVQLVRRDGVTVAWAKVSCSPLTDRLVTNEAHWLRLVADQRPDGLVVPTVLAEQRWHGAQVLVTEPLPDQRPTAPFVADAAVVRAVTGLRPHPDGPAHGSDWWHATRERVAAVSGPHAERVAELGDALAGRLADLEWSFGSWHGDLTRWNAKVTDAGVQVWDWERADHPRPAGFDAAHAAFQDAQVAHQTPVPAAADVADAAVAEVLAGLGLDPAGAPALVTAYLLERWLRWHADAALGATTATAERHDAILTTAAARSGIAREPV